MTFWDFAHAHPFLIGFLGFTTFLTLDSIFTSIANAVKR